MDQPNGPLHSGHPPAHDDLEHGIDRLTESIAGDRRLSAPAGIEIPDRKVIIELLHRLIALMYPGFFAPGPSPEDLRSHVSTELHAVRDDVARQIAVARRFAAVRRGDDAGDDQEAARLADRFLRQLPHVRSLLTLDVQAAFDGDPAATSTDEGILCSPGVHALTVHRIAHELYRLGVPLVPRMMHEHAHQATGIDIHPGARIARSFFVDHGTGVVIGETAVVGDHCKLYHGVTLGARSFPKDETGRLRRGEKRHPTLEDHVTVYAGASILGGDTVIGAGSTISGGVFLTHSVPPGHVVRGPRIELTLRSNPDMPPGMYSI